MEIAILTISNLKYYVCLREDLLILHHPLFFTFLVFFIDNERNIKLINMKEHCSLFTFSYYKI